MRKIDAFELPDDGGRLPTSLDPSVAAANPTSSTAPTQAVQTSNEVTRVTRAAQACPPPPLMSGWNERTGPPSGPFAFWLTQIWRRSGASIAMDQSDLSLMSFAASSRPSSLNHRKELEVLLALHPKPSTNAKPTLGDFLGMAPKTARQAALTGDVTKPTNSDTTTLANIPAAATDQLGTLLGDTYYWSASTVRARLAGNTSATMAVMTQTGNGTVSAAPVWTSTTGNGNIVRATSPALVTPVLGVASGTSLALSGGFGCNGASIQTAYTVNAACTDLATVVALCNQLRALLIANGQAV